MSGKFVVSLTRAKDNTDRATVTCAVANVAAAGEKEVVGFPSIEGICLSQAGHSANAHEVGVLPLMALTHRFVEAAGEIFVCSPPRNNRKSDEHNPIPGAHIVGGSLMRGIRSSIND